jgi:DNA-binding MarR family transcriptional regulator
VDAAVPPPAPQPRLRATPELTTLDIDILRYAVRHGMVTPEQLAARFFRSPESAQPHLSSLVAAGLLVTEGPLLAIPAVVRATPQGARLAGCDLTPASLDLARLRHNLALVDLSEELLATHPGSVWTTERELRRDRMRAARAFGGWERQGRVPDGLLRLEDGRRIAIELDLTPKRSARLDLLAGAYAVDRGVDLVWWYLPSETAVVRMRKLVAERGLDHLVEPRVRTVTRGS